LTAEEIDILLGRFNVSNPEEDSTTRKVGEIIIHENWDITNSNYSYDVAVFVLLITVEFSKTIRPICLPAPNEKLSNTGTIVGWGKSNSNANHEDIPRYLNVNILSGSECPYTFGELFKLGSRTITFCAGTESSNIF